MADYDFRTLNDKEFERLATDLLSAELKVTIERFKPGKDKGVDGRWFASPDKENIVQCKHWLKSGVAKLIKHLENTERAKLDRLTPSRYLLVTSLPLSRTDKQQISAALTPHVKSDADVIGAEDLNNYLAKQPDIERNHYKLWLSSSAVLRTLLNNAILGRSRAYLELMRDASRLYIRTRDYARAMDHLREHRVILLTGEPGIGKTTLANQLALEHTAKGWKLLVIEESLSEAEAAYSDGDRQVFYFDDFLGRTFFEALRAKQDSHVLNFIRRISRDPQKRFILTSRTSVLNQGMNLSDLYSETGIARNTYELKIGALSIMEKARILYNHVWHSTLDPELVDQLYVGKRYQAVIRHKNFNPRLVEFVLDAEKMSGVPAAGYWERVKKTFDDPAEVWRHQFDAQLSQDARDLAYAVALGGGPVSEADLRASFSTLREMEGATPAIIDDRFWKAVRQSVRSVLNRVVGEQQSVKYELFNPSIADYVHRRFGGTDLWRHYYLSLRTVGALTHLQQMKRQPFLGRAAYLDVMTNLVRRETTRFVPDAFSLTLVTLANEESELADDWAGLTQEWLKVELAEYEDLPPVSYLSMFVNAADEFGAQTVLARAVEIGQFLEHAYVPLDEPLLVSRILEVLDELKLSEVHASVRASVIDAFQDDLKGMIAANDVLGRYGDADDLEDAQSAVEKYIRNSLGDLGVDADTYEVREIASEFDVQEAVRENQEIAMREEYDAERWEGRGAEDADSSRAVDDLFERDSP